MPYYQKIIKAGKTIEVEKGYSWWCDRRKQGPRAPRQKLTPEKKMLANERQAEKKLRRLLNTNFTGGDYHLTLTYKKEERPENPEAAKKELKKFLRKLRSWYQKQGKELRYVEVTEYLNKAIHHHIVMNQGISLNELRKLWGKGIIRVSVLDDSGQYKKLAEYLIKETKKTFRSPDSASKKRWNPSRNLAKPIETKKYVRNRKNWSHYPKAFKGYQIEEDSIFDGINEDTGKLYQFYSMVLIE